MKKEHKYKHKLHLSLYLIIKNSIINFILFFNYLFSSGKSGKSANSFQAKALL